MWNENENEEMNVVTNSNEVANNEVHEPIVQDMPSQSSEPEKSSNKGLFIGLMVLILVLVACVAFAVTGGMKSDSAKFVELLTEDQMFVELLKDNGKYEQINVNVEVDVDDIAKELNEDELGIGKVTLKTTMNEKDDDFSGRVNLSVSELDFEIPEIQIMKTGKLVGINIEKVLPKAILADTEDINGLIENLNKLGLEIPESTEEHEYSDEDYEKANQFCEKYGKIILNGIEECITKEKEKSVTLDGEDYDVSNVYTLKIDGEHFLKTFYAVFQKLSESEDDIKYLEEIGALANVGDAEEFKTELDELLKETKEIIDEGNYEDILPYDIILKVYEKSGKTIATVLELDAVSISLYTKKEDNNNFDIVLEIAQDDQKVQVILAIEKDKTTTEGVLRIKADENDESIMDLKLAKFEVEKFKNAQEDMLKIDEDESISLNTVSEDEINDFVEEAYENITELLEPLSESDTSDDSDYDYDYYYEY